MITTNITENQPATQILPTQLSQLNTRLTFRINTIDNYRALILTHNLCLPHFLLRLIFLSSQKQLFLRCNSLPHNAVSNIYALTVTDTGEKNFEKTETQTGVALWNHVKQLFKLQLQARSPSKTERICTTNPRKGIEFK